MRLELSGKHLEITPILRRLVTTKLAKLERLLDHRALSARTVLTRERYRLQAEITLHARGENFLHGTGSSSSWELSVDQAIDKIAQQAQKIKGKWQERKRPSRRAGALAAEAAGLPASQGDFVDVDPADAVKSTPVRAASARPKGRERPRMPNAFRSSRQSIKSMSVAEATRAIDAKSDGVIIFRDAERSSISVLYRHNGELTLVETDV